MNETPKIKSGWRWIRRILIVLAILVTAIAIFYTEEDWRGKRAWENCKTEMEAKGIVMDWNKYIPPTIPNDENIFKAPKMQEWFTGRGQRELGKRLSSTNENLTSSFGEKSLINSTEVAKNYLAWSDQFKPDFDLIREALKRPYARMDGDYTNPAAMPIPNFLTARTVAQVLAQRAHCYFLLNQPDRALDELTLMHDLHGVLQPPPNGKPETLVAAMINVAIMGLYANEMEEGFQKSVWQKPQWIALQKQLADTDLIPWVFHALETEPVATTHLLEITPSTKLSQIFSLSRDQLKWAFWPLVKSALLPHGWIYQNMVNIIAIEDKPLSGVDSETEILHPKIIGQAAKDTEKSLAHKTPYNIIASSVVPNFTKAWQMTAHNQTLINEAQIACALERYKLANGNYPETLDALMPQFIEKIPRDIIGGDQLIYRRTNDGKFLLYSVGWNETDDGGTDLSPKISGSFSTNGDWVWKN